MMKKLGAMLLGLAVATGALAGCDRQTAQTEEKLQIVTTIFPEYDWVREILGEQAAEAEITMLLDNGVDLHSYQPTAEDIIKISACDLFIHVGGASDGWVDGVLAETENPDRKVINLMEILGDGVKQTEMIEGMQETEHAHEEENHEEENHEAHAHGADEHIWLSLYNAAILCEEISLALQEIDPEHGAEYEQNKGDYLRKIAALDGAYRTMVEGAAYDTVLFADRFPFRYMMDDYGLQYYAAFSGCAAESEASFETVLFLANKIDELGLPSVLTIDGTKNGIAETVVQNTEAKNQKILTLNSMQSVTGQDVENGVSYLSIMEENLAVLGEAIG